MIGLELRRVEIVPYDPAWSKAFADEKVRLDRILSDAQITAVIEHIGSTAVKGLAAKPIIDIAIGFNNPSEVGRALGVLVGAGREYVKAANQPGMLFMAIGRPQRQFHYHLVTLYTPAWFKLLVVRDYLRRHPAVATQYEDVKRQLAARYPASRLEYARGKDPFLRALVSRGFMQHRRKAEATAFARADRFEALAMLAPPALPVLAPSPPAETGGSDRPTDPA